MVALVSEQDPVPGLLWGEVLATGDVPPGVVALLSGLRSELLPWLGSHRTSTQSMFTGGRPIRLATSKRAPLTVSSGLSGWAPKWDARLERSSLDWLCRRSS